MGYEIREEVVPIEKLKPDPDNPNQMTEKQLKALAHSIQRFGELMPVLVDENYNIIDGEHRWKAMQLAGYDKIKVWIIKGAAEKDKRLIRQAMNKIRGTHDMIKDIKEFRRIVELGGKGDLLFLLNLTEEDLDLLQELDMDTNPVEEHKDDVLHISAIFKGSEVDEWRPIWEQIPGSSNEAKLIRLLRTYIEVEGA